MTSSEIKSICAEPKGTHSQPHPGALHAPLTQEEHSHGDHSLLQAVAQGDERISKQRAARPAQPLRGNRLALKLASAHPWGVTRLGAQACKPVQVSQFLVTPSCFTPMHLGEESSIWQLLNSAADWKWERQKSSPDQPFFHEVIQT